MKKSGMYRIVSYTAMQKIVNLRFFSSRLADTLCDELATKEEYAFVRDCIEFRELMAEMRS